MKPMLRKGSNSSAYGQLRWVILLLATAVILPTVCLLWFMNQAVKNVQLAARQKLITLYQDKLDKASEVVNQSWAQQLGQLDALLRRGNSPEPWDALFNAGHHPAIVYDSSGTRVSPLLSSDVKLSIDPSEHFRSASRLEFAEQRLAEAINLYEEEAQSANTYVRLSALIGKARCLTKLGRSDQAIEAYKEVAFCPEEATCDTATLMLIANTRLSLAELTKPTAGNEELSAREDFREAFSNLFQMIGEEHRAGATLPLDSRVFLARKSLTLAENVRNLASADPDMQADVNLPSVTEMLSHGELTLAGIERFPTAAELQQWPADQFRQLRLDEDMPCYCLRHEAGDKTVLLLQPDQMSGLGYEYDFKDTGIACRVLDNVGRLVTGMEDPESKPFLTARIGGYFPDWQVELFFEDDDILAGAAQKQMTLYVWGGVLVVALMLATGGFAGQRLNKQMRLNRLRNDFIATVSHELKTPLASMRVLADTLLEGNYKDQEQATEYLQLICKENKRLSGLIDDFLTFSRMERNKQAFAMAATSPADIAESAAEAVMTKFNGGRCDFEVDITENLPDVLADRDAMITVLVNLLDNAYKYSSDDRKIALRVFSEDRSVCFSVSDNGIGMSRRAARRIFERFYQADCSLTRRTEGCGLGLSIAKFIVDAHKGSITVDSTPGRGSTFAVKLPAVD